jgi:G3E family GTPase
LELALTPASGCRPASFPASVTAVSLINDIFNAQVFNAQVVVTTKFDRIQSSRGLHIHSRSVFSLLDI